MTWEELEHEPTPDLLDYIKSGADDASYMELADAAFIAFVFRFRQDLVLKCISMLRKWKRQDDDAIELANRVFARFRKYPRYDHAECISGNIDVCIRKYLYGIAIREMVAFLNPPDTPYDGTEEIIRGLVDEAKDYEPERLAILQEHEQRLDEIFAKLTPKHKIIFLTYKQHEHEGKRLPRQLLDDLRESLGLSQSSIRVYKKEAFELVQKELGNG